MNDGHRLLALALESAYDAGQAGEAFPFISYEQKVLEAIAQQPAAVDGAMVERMAQAVATELYGEPPPPGSNSLTRAMMLPGIKRALAAQPGGSDNDR